MKFSRLPVDIEISDLNFRLFFKDNYSEKKFAFTPWKYDPLELNELKASLPRDGVFVDVGTNVGLYTLFAGKHMSSQGTIMAFEPNPPTLKRLLSNLSFNIYSGQDWPQINLLDIGVADKESTLSLNVDEANLGASSIKEGDGAGPVTTIRCRPLCDVLQEYGIRAIDVLKIDIEGAEDIALAPFLHASESSLLPKLILIENSQDVWSIDLFGLLAEKGYERVLKTRLNSVFKLKSHQS